VRDSSPRTAPHASDRCTHTPLTSRRSLGGAIRNYRERVPDAIAQWQKDSASTKVPLPHSSLLPLVSGVCVQRSEAWGAVHGELSRTPRGVRNRKSEEDIRIAKVIARGIEEEDPINRPFLHAYHIYPTVVDPILRPGTKIVRQDLLVPTADGLAEGVCC
jgi:hypothetical protein